MKKPAEIGIEAIEIEKEIGVLREIIVLKEIIRMLKACLKIHFENLEIKNALKTYKDIKKCTKELDRLIAARKDELGAIKEPAKNATTVRSGKSLF